jgi:orotate phosphoribosyltransferase
MEPLRRFPVDRLSNRTKVYNLIKDRSFFRGKVTLASGKESDFYFDLKPTMFDPEGARLLAELILERLENEKVDFIGGLAVGAIPLISPVNLLSFEKRRPIPGFFVRKDIKTHGTKKLVEGTDNESLKGKRVVILDDVTTTGSSAMQAVNAAREAGAITALVLTVVDRGEGAAEFYKGANIPFDWLFTASEFLKA